ncbi:hypothetical protein [Sanguibacter massiliensis]|uniref:hypothetical protein n=1 Tax=Sanguibacter massiliensis TaxID=1973217 RepID=UPI000C819E37|nr:hypothetical protein [Sanguibacter massiliensis]
MAIFELDAERAVAVQAMEPAPGAVGAQVEQIIEQRLGAILGERLLTVARGRAGHDEPFLLSVDGFGGVVVTEIVTNLDAATLASALVRAGCASRLGDAELAQRYHRGPQAFVGDRSQLFTTVPEVVGGERRPGGARLVVVCAAVALDALDALEFLRQPGSRVEVLRVGVLRGTDGRRVLDVSPLGLGGRGPRGLEPTEAAPTAAAAAPAAATSQVTRTSVLEPRDPVDHESERRRLAAMVSTQALPVVTDPQVEQPQPYEHHAVPAAVHTAGPSAYVAGPSAPVEERPPVHEPVSPVRTAIGVTQAPSRAAMHPRPYHPSGAPGTTGATAHPAGYAGARYRARLASVEEVSIDTNPNDLSSLRDSSRSFAAAMAYGDPSPATAQVYDAPALADPEPEPAPFEESSLYDTASYDAHSYDAHSYDTSSYGTVSHAPGHGATSAPAQPAHEPRAQAPKGPRDPALEALAARLDGPAPLVWVRHRRGESIHATLFTDGIIELDDGQRFWSADLAASAAVGAPGVDGWRMWRLGDETGPTLAECR